MENNFLSKQEPQQSPEKNVITPPLSLKDVSPIYNPEQINEETDGMGNIKINPSQEYLNLSPTNASSNPKVENTQEDIGNLKQDDKKGVSPQTTSQQPQQIKQAKTFIQRTSQQTPSYPYPKNSTTSPIYDYFGEGQKYLSTHQTNEEANTERNNNYVKKATIGGSPVKTLKSPQVENGQTPNYRDFDIFNIANSPEKTPVSPIKNVIQFPKPNLGLYMEEFQNNRNNMNNQPNPRDDFQLHMMSDDQEPNDNMNNNYKNLLLKQNLNQKPLDFGNFRQNNNPQDFLQSPFMMNNPSNNPLHLQQGMGGMGSMGMGNNPNQKMPMFPYFSNDSFLSQQQMNISKLNKEDYLFEKFGKRGWQCMRCNNFNFETRNKCNKCGLPMTPKIISKNRRDDYFNPDEKKKKPLIERKGDWLCPKCRNLNFAFRLICNRCQLPKSDAVSPMPFTQSNPLLNQRGGGRFPPNLPQSQNFNFQPNNYPNSLMGNSSNINIYNNFYNLNNHNGKNVGNPNLLTYMNKMNSQQKGMNDNNNGNINTFNQFPNFDPKSIQSNINNGPQNMPPKNFGLNMNNLNNPNFEIQDDFRPDDIENDEEDSSGDEDDGTRKF